MDDTRRTVQEVIDLQNVEPIWIVNQTGDNLIDDTPFNGRSVFKALGLTGGKDINTGGFYPLTDKEQKYGDEDSVDAPYGGAVVGPAWLFQGKKYLGAEVEVCYYTDPLLFSFGSYAGTLWPDRAVALSEARRLADFLTPKISQVGGMAVAIEGVPDRHFVVIMFPPDFVTGKFADLGTFKDHVANLFDGYEPATKPLKRLPVPN